MTFDEILKSMSFEDSMLKCNSPMNSSDRWSVMEKAYNDFYVSNIGKALPPKIPKILHQIWLGSPLPNKYKILIDLWKQRHPDWTFLLWDEKAVDDFGLTNRWMYDRMKNPSAKSDVIRYEVAYSYGGIYADTDFLNLRSFDDLLHLDFFVGIGGSYNGNLVVPDTQTLPGIFGCTQGNLLVSEIIKEIGAVQIIPTDVPSIMNLTGPNMFARKVTALIDQHPNSVVFPVSYFYPFPAQQRETIRNIEHPDMIKALEPYIYPETFTAHLWYCSWQRPDLL